MPGQIHVEDVVSYWRIGVLDLIGHVESVCSINRTSEASTRSMALNISKLGYVRETWIRPVFVGGLIGAPVQYYRNGEEVR